jgi:tetratricopeptide (TPR) repeat protein
MADISPELAARIEQLKSSHHENPARFFMPLASAYREAGEQARAEELLRDNLKRHPGYLSAHVLLGRCLADRGVIDEARNEFQYVLSIDSQNLIALRTLGEMAAASGNRDEARRWYGDLLAVDPMNSEARHALDALEAAAPAPAAEPAWDPYGHGVSGGEPVVERAPEPAQADFGEMEPVDFDMPRLEPAPELGFGAVSLPDPPADDDSRGWGEVELDAAPPASTAPDTSGFDAMDFGSVDLNPAEATWTDGPAAADDAPLAADPSAGWGLSEPAAEPAPLELRSFDEEAQADDVEVVTETMAELLYRQGFIERSAEVYRELIARRGDEPALTQRLEQIELELRGGADAPVEIDGGGTMAVARDETPSWLEAVEARAADPPAEEGVIDLMDLPDVAIPDPVQPFETATAPTFDDIVVAEDVAAGLDDVAGTGDSFSDSFAHGFDGAPAASGVEPAFPRHDAPADEVPLFDLPTFDPPAFEVPVVEVPPFEVELEEVRSEWSTPTVEPTAPLAGMMDEAEPAGMMDEAQPSAEAPSESVTSYLWSIMSWRPSGAGAPAAREDTAAPPPAEAWDEETLGAPEQQPPLDEPWMAAAANEAELTHSTESDDEPWAVPSASTEDLLPADDGSDAVDELPWLANDEPAEAAPADELPWLARDEPARAEAEPVDELPWLAQDDAAPAETAPLDDFVPFDLPAVEPAGTEGAGSAAPDEAMPWEGGLDLPDPFGGAPAVEVPAQPEVAPPAGGFSLEDFFSEPRTPLPAPAAAAPRPEPAPPEPAAPAPRADEDEDLESFQAWLQSLKR